MADIITEVLSKYDLQYSDLRANEREYLQNWLSSLKSNTLTLPKVKDYISAMRAQIEQELTEKSDTPTSWLTITSFLIPIIGIIRKWYADQRKVELTARLRNYVLLEQLLTSPEKAQENLERQVAAFASNIKH